jgi:hypothetical protein
VATYQVRLPCGQKVLCTAIFIVAASIRVRRRAVCEKMRALCASVAQMQRIGQTSCHRHTGFDLYEFLVFLCLICWQI